MTAINFSPGLAAVISRAYRTGCETSIRELANLLGLDEGVSLSAAIQVVAFVESFDLELEPKVVEGEFVTPRILRSKVQSSSNLADEIFKIIDQGEGPGIEFKSSMLCSMHEWRTNRNISILPSLEGEILKTICAFLNSEGGELLVGVSDDGAVCDGISVDLKAKNWNSDKWELHFRSLIDTRFQDGRYVQKYLKTAMVDVDNLPVFHVSVLPRSKRSFVRKAKGNPYEFFIRNGPRTDSLDLPEFYAHMASAFSS